MIFAKKLVKFCSEIPHDGWENCRGTEEDIREYFSCCTLYILWWSVYDFLFALMHKSGNWCTMVLVFLLQDFSNWPCMDIPARSGA